MASTLENFYRGKKVLVTGHTGFKGAWLCEWLLGLGASVTGYSIDIPTEPSLFEAVGLGSRMRDLRGDVRDLFSLRKVFASEKPEILFHLAAQPLVRASYDDPKLTFDTNVGGTVNVLELLREKSSTVKSAVIVTTDKCYENVGKDSGYREEDPLGGSDPYSASKACAEIAFSSYARSFFTKDGGLPNGVAIASARAGNVIGGGDWAQDRIIADCVRAWSRKEEVTIRNPDSVRPWQHVLEPVGAYLLLAARLMEKPAGVHGEAFNFGPTADANFRTIDLVNEIERLWSGTRHVISPVAGGAKKEAKLLRLNCEKAREVLAWNPVLGFSEYAAWLVEWYKTYYENPGAVGELTKKQIANYQSKFYRNL